MDGIIDSMDMTLSKLWEILKDREAWHAAVHGDAKLDMTEGLNNNNVFRCIPMGQIQMFLCVQTYK